MVAAPFVGYFGDQISADVPDTQFRSVASSAVEGGVDADPMFDIGLVHLVGLVAAFTMTLSARQIAFGARQSTEAWHIGAEGERLTGRALQRLPASYRVLHDLPMPRSKANIDHVVVGQTGVFTVETKNYKNGVTIRTGSLWLRPQAGPRGAAGSPSGVSDRRQDGGAVIPIVCVHGGGVTVNGWFQKPVVDGVRFCSGRGLAKTITGYPVELNETEIHKLERRLA